MVVLDTSTWNKIFRVVYSWGPPIALVFQVLVLSRFLTRRNHDYPIAIVFTVVLFLLSAYVYASRVQPDLILFGANRDLVVVLTDLIMHILLLTLMLQLTRQTLSSLGQDSNSIWILAALSFAVLIVSYTIFNGPSLQLVFAKVRQVVSFWMVLLNLYWWSLLLRKGKVDRRTMLLSAGIGIMMTGQTVGDGILSISSQTKSASLRTIGTTIIFLTIFASLYAWYQAFHTANARRTLAES